MAKSNGQDRYTTEIVASEMQMLDSRGSQGGYDQQSGSAMAPPPPQQSTFSKPPNQVSQLSQLDRRKHRLGCKRRYTLLE